MAEKINTGGSAFPTHDVEFDCGMTLRDYFAIKMLPEIYRNAALKNSLEGLSKRAYQFADAMIAEREKSNA
jgi:hypothetical protein